MQLNLLTFNIFVNSDSIFHPCTRYFGKQMQTIKKHFNANKINESETYVIAFKNYWARANMKI